MSSRFINWFKFSSPATFYPLAGKIAWVSTLIAVVLIAIGLYMSFFVAPTDYKQGEGYRIIFVHVPASWMSMFLYVVMAGWAALGLGRAGRAGRRHQAQPPKVANYPIRLGAAGWAGFLGGMISCRDRQFPPTNK